MSGLLAKGADAIADLGAATKGQAGIAEQKANLEMAKRDAEDKVANAELQKEIEYKNKMGEFAKRRQANVSDIVESHGAVAERRRRATLLRLDTSKQQQELVNEARRADQQEQMLMAQISVNDRRAEAGAAREQARAELDLAEAIRIKAEAEKTRAIADAFKSNGDLGLLEAICNRRTTPYGNNQYYPPGCVPQYPPGCVPQSYQPNNMPYLYSQQQYQNPLPAAPLPTAPLPTAPLPAAPLPEPLPEPDESLDDDTPVSGGRKKTKKYRKYKSKKHRNVKKKPRKTKRRKN